MLKNKKNLIIILCILGGFIFLINKVITLKTYYVEPIQNQEELINNLKENTTMTISKKILKEEEYSNESKFKIKNNFNEYIRVEENNIIKYVQYNALNEISNAIYLSSSPQYIDLITSNSFEIHSTTQEKEKNNKKFNDQDRKKFLKKHNINNDLDLLKYIKNNYYLKSNMFTSLEELKENYIVNSFVELTLPAFESITIISGEHNGYILNNNSNRVVNILENNKLYQITFIGNELITDNYIQEFLNTLIIKK